jgi:acetyl esterase/lipase
MTQLPITLFFMLSTSALCQVLLIAPDHAVPADSGTDALFISRSASDPAMPGAIDLFEAHLRKKLPVELHIAGQTNEWRDAHARFVRDQEKNAATPAPLTYKAKDLPQTDPPEGLTMGDHRLRQLLGRDCPVIPLWPGQGTTNSAEVVTHKSRGGNALNITQVTQPTVTVVQPLKSKSTGRAVIVCPGGAYQGLAAEHEGVKVCEWLNSQGITGILLKYRVPRDKDRVKHARGVADLQRALRLVRANSSDWSIDPAKIGILGFSAGGHACATLSTHFDTPFYPLQDDIDKLSARPDFSVLIYPAYLEGKGEIDPLFSELKRVNVPPLFSTAAANDRFVKGLLLFFAAAHEADIPMDLHIYPSGGHGGGIDPVSYPASEWVNEAERWLLNLK